MTKYVFKGGIPFAFKWGWLPVIPFFTSGLIDKTWNVKFDDLWTLPDPKNHSWQKGGGQSYDPFNNHVQSIMWAFRRVNPIDEIQFSSYAHVNGSIVKEDNNVLKLHRGEEAEINIIDDRNAHEYIVTLRKVNSRTNDIVHKIPYTHNRYGGKTIMPWFEYPPGKIVFHMECQ